MPQPLSASHIFISYSRRDNDAMRRVVTHLRGQGLKAWVDNEKLVPGTPIWEREIEKAIDAAFAVVVVLSPDAKESIWVLNELTLADELKKRVFPVIVRGDFRDAVPFRLVTRQFVDLRINEASGLESLSTAIGQYLDGLKRLEEERLATEEEAERQKQEDAKHLAAQSAEEKQVAQAKLEAEQRAEEKRLADEKAETERKAKEEAQRLAAQKAEEERLAEEKHRADEVVKAERKAKKEAERLAAQKAEEERQAKARTEAERLAKEKAEADRLAKEKADRLAAQKAEEERLAKKGTNAVTQEFKYRTPAPKVETRQPQPIRPPWFAIGVAGIAIVGIFLCGFAVYKLIGGGSTATPAKTEAPFGPTASTKEVATEPPKEIATPLPPFSGKSLTAPNCDYGGYIKSIEATDRYSVTFNLCKPEPAFLSKIALDNFAIYPEEWIEATANNGTRSSDGLEHPIGTGPYTVSEWVRGDHITFLASTDYWGTKPKTQTLVFRWASDASQRLLELQAGNVDGIDSVSTDDLNVVSNDSNLSLLIRPSSNVSFIGMTNTFAPFDNQLVRKALAMGIDRQRIVNNFYPLGTELATHFVPCYIPNGCVGDDWYDFDPEQARALLAEAGYPGGFSTKIYYRDVVRSYLPRPGDIAQDIQTQLRDNLNIEAEIVVMESTPFIQGLTNGELDGLFLYGWTADYPHPASFMNTIFDTTSLRFGTQSPTYVEPLKTAFQITDPAQATFLYTQANNAILEYVPMIPIAHTSSAIAYQANIENQPVSALWDESFAYANPNNRDTFIWMQTSEPISLFCADESGYDSLRACAQVMEPLYSYNVNGTEARPVLAEGCEPVDDVTWVCTLRQGVIFHDGTTFDANDVVTTFTMGLDASSPLHAGNANDWSYYDFIWGLMNKPQQ